jgi:hypothetical protein
MASGGKAMDMAKHIRTTIRFDGAALTGHEMDVQELAPALLALADLIQLANRRFNGDKATMRVLVNADVEQHCFMLDISLVQTFVDQAKTFFARDDVATVKEIAEWIGLIGGPSMGLLLLIKRLVGARGNGAKLIEATADQVTITIPNGGVFVVPRQVYDLAQDQQVNDRVRKLLGPLRKPGYETLAFLDGDKQVFEVDEIEAAAIIDTDGTPVDPPPTDAVSTIKGTVRIKSAQYEGAAKWSLLWGGRAIDAEMVDEAAEWVSQFQNNLVAAPPNSVLDVTMTEAVKLDPDGNALGKPSYRVTAVHGITPPPTQIGLI